MFFLVFYRPLLLIDTTDLFYAGSPSIHVLGLKTLHSLSQLHYQDDINTDGNLKTKKFNTK